MTNECVPGNGPVSVYRTLDFCSTLSAISYTSTNLSSCSFHIHTLSVGEEERKWNTICADVPNIPTPSPGPANAGHIPDPPHILPIEHLPVFFALASSHIRPPPGQGVPTLAFYCACCYCWAVIAVIIGEVDISRSMVMVMAMLMMAIVDGVAVIDKQVEASRSRSQFASYGGLTIQGLLGYSSDRPQLGRVSGLGWGARWGSVGLGTGRGGDTSRYFIETMAGHGLLGCVLPGVYIQGKGGFRGRERGRSGMGRSGMTALSIRACVLGIRSPRPVHARGGKHEFTCMQ